MDGTDDPARSDAAIGPDAVEGLSRLLQDILRASGDDPIEAWNEALRPGERIARFEIRREVGRGGFGAVYEAFDSELGRAVALKTLRPGRTRSELRQDWVKLEAEAVAKLHHPNIVTLFDVGTCPQGPFLVMELLQGETLAERIGRGPLPVDEALRVSEAVARGLAHAHQRGVLHRDIKPGNVFLAEGGEVKILDFGLAHLLGRKGSASGGTAAYMAPEQARGEEVDARADIYSAGVLLRETLRGHQVELRATAPGLPRAVGRLVARATAPSRDDRPRDGQAWLDEVVAARRAIERPRKARLVASLVVVGLLAGIAASYLVLARGPITRAAADASARSIAVLPFADLSQMKDQEYLADGIAEEILNVLSRVEGLKVAGRASSFFFKGKNAEAGEIGKKLDVDSILEGSVRRDGNRIRVMAELVNARDGIRLWSETYEREFEGVFAIQDDIAKDVARSLRLKLQPGAGARRSTVPEAYTEYLLARQFDRQVARGNGERMLAALDRAVTLDPSFAPAWAFLANVRLPVTRAGDPDPPERAEAERSSLEAAERAIALDPQGEEGYTARGWWRICMKLDLPGASADVERALQLSPSSADAQMLLGWVHLGDGRTAEASNTFKRVTALDPLSWRRWYSLALVLKGLGDYPGAREAARRTLEIAPEWRPASDVLLDLDLVEGFPDRVLQAIRSESHDQRRLFYTALAEHSLGHAAEAGAALAEYLRRFGAQNPSEAAQIQAWMGLRDDAFASLARFDEVERPYGLVLLYVPHDPLFRNLHADPRWKPYLGSLGLRVN